MRRGDNNQTNNRGGRDRSTSKIRDKSKDRSPIVTRKHSKLEPMKDNNLKLDQTTEKKDPLNTSNISHIGGGGRTDTKYDRPGKAQPVQGNVSVICRFRPLNEKEKNISQELCVDFVDKQQVVINSNGEHNHYRFQLDRIFDTNSNQQEVYDHAAKPIIESVLEGFNGTIFAYGQTSSGKTHTMQGILNNIEREGIIPRMIRHVFNFIINSPPDIEYTVKVSMIEIYMEKIKDLIDLDRYNLNVREDKAKGIYIEGLSEHYMASEEEVLEIMRLGSDNRSVAATNMNEHSSRSHSIFIMTIHQHNLKDASAKTGKLYLVDLAGSEKISKTGATGLTLEEAKTINRSLTTLGMVINSLTDGRSTHIPYRESKLTRVLQESLGGNAKTCLIITCSPSVYNESETLSTMRFGLRAKQIKNKPKINKEVTVAELKIEIDRLDKTVVRLNNRIIQLENYIRKNGLPVPPEDDLTYEIEEEIDIVRDDITDNIIPADDLLLHDGINHNESDVIIHSPGKKANSEDMPSPSFSPHIKHKDSDDVNNIIVELDLNKRMSELDVADDDLEMLKKQILNVQKDTEQLKLDNPECLTPENFKFQGQDEFNEMLESTKKTFEAREKELLLQIDQLKQELENEKVKNVEVLDTSIRNTIAENTAEKFNPLSPPSIGLMHEFFSKLEDIVHNDQVSQLVQEYKNKLPEGEYKCNCKNYDEMMESERKNFENEKRLILRALDEKAEKLIQHEMENKHLGDKIKILETKMPAEDRNYVKKILMLEKNLEQLNAMLQQALTQKSIVSIEIQVRVIT
jgi:kinesin family protein 5